MTELEPIPYPDAKIRGILQRVKTIAMVGASANWNRPSYFVMKYLQGKGYRCHPGQPGPGRADACTAKPSTPRCATSRSRSIWSISSAPRTQCRPDRRRRHRHRRQGGVDAARRAQRRGRGAGRGGGPRSGHEPLPEDRVRPAGRRAVLVRRQFRPYPQPRRREPPHEPRRARSAPVAVRAGRPGLRDQGDPCRRRARPRHRRAHRRRSTRPRPIVFDDVDHAASLFNLHNFGHLYTPLSNPTVAVLEERVASAGGRARGAWPRRPAMPRSSSPSSRCWSPGDEFLASRNLYGGSLTQFGQSFQKLGWTLPFRRSRPIPRISAAR